jgi:hypothetical protein
VKYFSKMIKNFQRGKELTWNLCATEAPSNSPN